LEFGEDSEHIEEALPGGGACVDFLRIAAQRDGL
jgi:hypothetical protein